MCWAMIQLICTERSVTKAVHRRQPIEVARTERSRLTAYAPSCDWMWVFWKQLTLRYASLSMLTDDICSRSQRLPERASVYLCTTPTRVEQCCTNMLSWLVSHASTPSPILANQKINAAWKHAVMLDSCTTRRPCTTSPILDPKLLVCCHE